jgi:hypothetical protein
MPCSLGIKLFPNFGLRKLSPPNGPDFLIPPAVIFIVVYDDSSLFSFE